MSNREEPAEARRHQASLARNTRAVSLGRGPGGHDAPVNPPLVFSSTFHGTAEISAQDYGYGRFGNPTWDPFEETLASLEDAEPPALTFASGLAAMHAVLALLPPGGIVVAARHSYQGSLSLLQTAQDRGELVVRTVDILNTEEVRAALVGADMLWIESPTNPMLEVADLDVLFAAMKAENSEALCVCDNTFATPILQRPLNHGADIVVHSVSKFLSGHSDVILGAAVTRSPEMRARLWGIRSLTGAVPGPMEVWLALRGMRTLALRVERSCANALEIARRLQGDPRTGTVRYPGLPDDPGYAVASRQMDGYGAIVCVELPTAEQAERVCEEVRIFTPATSLGGVESLIERRRRHAAEPATVPAGLLRLSIGIEDIDDLWADLSAAIELATTPSR